MGRKPYGWCELHCYTITASRYREKCSVAKRGKVCGHFSFHTPEWKAAFHDKRKTFKFDRRKDHEE